MPQEPEPPVKAEIKGVVSARDGRRPHVGLALGSGGSRGIVHIGILETMTEMGIPIDMIAGSSIGAVIGGIFCLGGLQRLKHDLISLKREDLLRLFDPVLSLSGLFAAKKAMGFLERYIPPQARIEDAPIPLGIVATDYETGHPVVFRKGNLLEAIRASMSIPGIFTPVRIGGALMLDGGVADPLPIDVAKAMGARLVIAVSLQPALGRIGLLPPISRQTANPPKGKPSSGPLRAGRLSDHLYEGGRKGERDWLQAAEAWLGSQESRAPKSGKAPNIFEILVRAIDIMGYTNTLMMLASHPPTVLFEFELPEVPTLDFSSCSALIDEGRHAVTAKKEELAEKIGFAGRTTA
jgi:NTE family protein